MSYHRKDKASKELAETIKGFLPGNTHNPDAVIDNLMDKLDEYIDARIEDAEDRLYNRGDYWS